MATATAAADAAGRVLIEQYGAQPWIMQIMTAVETAVDNGILNLSGGAGPMTNAQSLAAGGQYQFPARTAEELRASQAEVASHGQVSKALPHQGSAIDQGEQALANGQISAYQQLQQQAGLADPASQAQAPKQEGGNGWLL